VTLSAGARLGPYEIVSPLGAGGMGEVYRARDTRLDRDVAVKVLPPQLSESPEALARFEREAKAVAALSHANIVALHDFGKSDGTVYAVTELLEGETLRARVAAGAIPARKSVEYGLQIANGLSAAHEKGIVHRDLKPENVFVTKSGTVKILDFGLARQLVLSAAGEDTHSPTVARATDPGTVLGTVGYMSPEQVRGKLADHRSDIFSFGCILYEMLSGRRAFQGQSPAETMASIARDDPPELSEQSPGVPPGLERIVRHCLEKSPEERFQSARDLAFDLGSLSSVSAPQKAVARGAPDRRRWLLAAAAGVALLAAGAAAGWLWASRSSRSAAPPTTFRFQQLTDTPGEELTPRLSPDGKTLLYVSRAAGNLDIYSLRVGGRNAVNLTADSKEDDWGPAFSADGRQIAFRSERGGGGIYLMEATGESVRRLTDFGYDPSWSPDGSEIVVATEGVIQSGWRVEVSQLWVVSTTDGKRKRLLTKGDAVNPVWSPEGTRIAYWGVVGTGKPPAVRTILASGPEEGGIVPLIEATGEPDSSGETGREPAWSADGRTIYFSSLRSGTPNIWRVPVEPKTGRALGRVEPVSVPASWASRPSLSRQGTLLAFQSEAASTQIRKIPFDSRLGQVAGPGEEILSSSRKLEACSLSPDGAWLALTQVSPYEDLLLLKLDGSAARQLTNDRPVDRTPRFSPDGTRVAFFSPRSGRPQVWEIHTDGSGLRHLPLEGHDLFFPVYSPDGSRLVGVDEKGSTWRLDLQRPDSGWVLVHRATEDEPLPDGECSWSRDGRQLACDLTDRGYRSLGLYVESIDTGERRRLTESGETPVWLADSRRLLYQDAGVIRLLDTETGRSSVVVAASRAPRQLDTFDVSTDDAFIVINETTSQSDIWLATEEETPP
jgi:eukaryotic-like serine/threonine-protein kinase